MAARTGHGASTLSQAAAGERLPTLPVVLAYVQACEGDLQQWEERWRQAAAEEAAEPRADDNAEPPYRGLSRFEPGDAGLFFGRDQLIDDLLHLARHHRVTAVVGASGSGKSSLLRAGLIPRLRTTDDPGLRPAALLVLTPGPHPLREHERRLAPKEGEGDTWVVVDQMEELYTLCTDPAERAQFIDHLLTAQAPGSRLRVLIAVRADFFGHLAGHRALADALRDATFLVAPMNRDELRAAIVKPAQATGLVVERTLTARIIDEVAGEPGALPLMSHALRETWHRRKGPTLTLTAYEAAGGVHGAIAQTAEDLCTHLTPAQAAGARRILLRLINPGEGAQDTRRPVPREELETDSSSATAEVLERLVKARLVILDGNTVHLAHEALIAAWPRLKEWIDEDRQQLALHRRLSQDARAWDDLGRDASALYRGVRLVTAEDAFATRPAGELTRLEQAFLAESRARRDAERRRRRTFTSSLAMLLVLALVAGVLAWQQNAAGDLLRTQAAARRAAAVATSMRSSDPVKALQLAVAAWKTNHTPETRSALLGALTQREEAPFTPPVDADAEQFVSADGRILVSAGAHRITKWDVATHRKIGTFKGLGSQTVNLGGMSPDALRLAMVIGASRVQLWDIRKGHLDGPVMGPIVMPRTSVHRFSADSRTLIVAANNQMELWGIQPQRRLFKRRTSRDLADMAASPDGRFVALCPQGGSLELWDVRRHKRLPSDWFPQKGCASEPADTIGMEFSPDSRSLFIPDEQSLQRREIPSGRKIPTLSQPSLDAFAFSEDGRFIVSAGASEILLWRTSRPESPVLRYPLVTASTNGLYLDMARRQIRYVSDNLASATTVNSLDVGSAASSDWRQQATRYATFSADGSTMGLAWRRGRKEHFELRAAASGRVIATLPEADLPPADDMVDPIELMSLSKDGKTFAFGMGNDSTESSYANTVRVWDVLKRREINHFTTVKRGDGLSGMLLSSDGRKLMTTDFVRNGVTVRSVRSSKILKTLHYTKDGTTFGAGGELTAVRPDGGLLLTNSGKMISSPSGNETPDQLGDAQTHAFSADGRYFAADEGDGRVALWDGKLRRRLGVLTGSFSSGRRDDLEEVSALAFSHDSSTLAVAGSQGTLQLWDVASHQVLGSPMPTPGDGILSVVFSQDDATIYSAGEHVSWQKNLIDPEHAAAIVCERAQAPLSQTDWKTYLPGVTYRRTC
ncbi:nSTAND1 domain-containing NTPase [Streptomyces asiaticus]|uniref:WD40 repeat domain-containing protein n=1 Tax=Streptomyces asiaticus TaxID=114695 RepID=UPI003F66F2FC